MLKKLILPLMACAILCAGIVLADGGREAKDSMLPGCDFTRLASFVVGSDTLYFTKATPARVNIANVHASTDWYAPKRIPIGVDRQGYVLKEMRRVKVVKMVSRVPFSYQAFYASGDSNSGGGDTAPLTANGVYDYADTLRSSAQWGIAAANVTIYEDAFPCVAWAFWPDSLRIKEGGADSVRVYLGY